MKMILPLVFLLSLRLSAQDYSTYYQLINRAEEQFFHHRDTSCFADYDQAFAHYEPFLKDPYIAAQLALYLKDTTRFFTYLGVCFRNGMPFTAVDASPLIRKAREGEVAHRIQELYESDFRPKWVDQDLLNKICLQCYQSDSIKMTEGVNAYFHQSENDTRTFLLDSLLRQGKFPNERLLGITTNALQEEFHTRFQRPDLYADLSPYGGSALPSYEEFELRRKCPYNIILHSKCFYTDHKKLFHKAMINGYIHPKEIGILEETAILWNNDQGNGEETCEPLPYRVCYNIFGYNPMRPSSRQTYTDTAEGLQLVEANRAEIFMQKYSVDVWKKEMEKESGIRFFFDFKDR